jgi:hypothetical protein
VCPRCGNISCHRFAADAGGRRCRHYLEGGFCDLDTEFRCVEWMKKNGQLEEAERIVRLQAEELGLVPRKASPGSTASPAVERTVLLHRLSDDDVASWKALGVEVCIASDEVGEVWLVPEYTGQSDRKELRIDHAVALTAVCGAFPGARITSFGRHESAEGKP